MRACICCRLFSRGGRSVLQFPALLLVLFLLPLGFFAALFAGIIWPGHECEGDPSTESRRNSLGTRDRSGLRVAMARQGREGAVLWEIAKAETTSGNARHAAKRMTAWRQPERAAPSRRNQVLQRSSIARREGAGWSPRSAAQRGKRTRCLLDPGRRIIGGSSRMRTLAVGRSFRPEGASLQCLCLLE